MIVEVKKMMNEKGEDKSNSFFNFYLNNSFFYVLLFLIPQKLPIKKT